MKRNKSNTHFWPVLAAVNVLALIYPINLMRGAESADESFFGALALIGVLFLLISVDAVSIVVAAHSIQPNDETSSSRPNGVD